MAHLAMPAIWILVSSRAWHARAFAHGRTTAAARFGHGDVSSRAAKGPPLREARGERWSGSPREATQGLPYQASGQAGSTLCYPVATMRSMYRMCSSK